MKTAILLLLIITSSSFAQMSTSLREPHELETLEQEFSNYSAKHGFNAALIKYAAENAVKPQPNRHPIIGMEALIKELGTQPDTEYTVTWRAVDVDMSASGDLGYTWGYYYIKTKTAEGRDTTRTGNYYTIWKKQQDSTWKWVLDAGNPAPPQQPKKKYMRNGID